MSDPDDLLDAEELEYSLDLPSTNLDFEEIQLELKYSMDLSTNSRENTDSELSSNNDNGSRDLSSDTDLGTGSELSYDDDDELTNLSEHLKRYNLEKILFQTVKMMKTLMLALIVIRSIAEKEILIGVLVDMVGQWRQRLRVFIVEIQTKLLIITSKVINV